MEQLLRVAQPQQVELQRIAVVRAQPQRELADGVRPQASPLQVLPGRLSLGRLQDALVEARRGGVGLVQGVDLLRALARGKADARPPGKIPQGLREGQPLRLHDEGEEVAALGAGAEAAPGLALREDVEGGRALRVEGAPGLEVAPGLGQRDVPGDDVDDVQALLDLVYGGHGTSRSAGMFSATRVYACRAGCPKGGPGGDRAAFARVGVPLPRRKMFDKLTMSGKAGGAPSPQPSPNRRGGGGATTRAEEARRSGPARG